MTRGPAFAMALVLALFVGWGCRAAQDAPLAGLGANKFDLLLDFTGRAGGGDGSDDRRRTGREMAVKAIADGRAEGFSFFRVAAAGYGPSWPNDPVHNDLARWMTAPGAYWSDVDAMFAELDAHQMRLVPSLLWNIKQFPALTGETVSDLVKNPTSRSRALAVRYITEFVSRYKARRTILFYEIGNEFNLLADLDSTANCHMQFGIRQFCAATGNFSSADLLTFSRYLVGLFKRLDPSRGVSSGYSSPRPAAAHLARRPQFGQGGADWTADSAPEFNAMLLMMNAPFDLVSLHIYPDVDEVRPAFGVRQEADMAGVVATLFHKFGKQVFVGEFGDRGGSRVIADVMDRLRRGQVDYAAVWVWESTVAATARPAGGVDRSYFTEPGHGDEALGAAIAAPQGHQ